MKTIEVYCENTRRNYVIEEATSLRQFAGELFGKENREFVACLIDNQLRALDFCLYNSHRLCFIPFTHPDGMRTYVRSLSFLLQKACHDLYPEALLEIRNSVSMSLYCLLRFPDDRPITQEHIEHIEHAMFKCSREDIPFVRKRLPTDEANRLFKETGCVRKALLQQTRGRFYTTVYYVDDFPGTFYGPLVPSTGYLTLFNLALYNDGFLLQYPSVKKPNDLEPVPKLHKLFDVFQEYAEWSYIMNAKNVGSINRMIQNGQAVQMIQVGEALHERKFAHIADQLHQRRDTVKIALIAGPSSSGKTTTSKRIALQCKVVGLNPIVLALDNYFVDRDETPRDEKGEYDYETIEALDLPFLNEQLYDLLKGKTIQVPRFDFTQGKRFFDGPTLKMDQDDILIVEGIHALNPRLTEGIPAQNKYKIYASALTSLSMDENNRIPTTDNRLLRRIVRDSKYRGASADEVIARWSSVRRGEDRNIFPFQEEADIMFNSALPFELFVLRNFAEPLLRCISPCSPARPEALRLLNFLSYIAYISLQEMEAIPPTSVLREFIGGSSFKY